MFRPLFRSCNLSAQTQRTALAKSLPSPYKLQPLILNRSFTSKKAKMAAEHSNEHFRLENLFNVKGKGERVYTPLPIENMLI
jgi:hypothetical protein